MSWQKDKLSLERRQWLVEWLRAEGGYSTIPEVEAAMAASDQVGSGTPAQRQAVARMVVGRMLRKLAEEGVVAVRLAEGGPLYGVTAKCEPLRRRYGT